MVCCSLSSDKVEAARCLMKQFFDDYDDESCSTADKQQLKNEHNKEHVKLSQLLDTSEVSRLSVEHFSSEQHHKSMCSILENFFKGIDDTLPPPTIIQVYNVIAVKVLRNIQYRLFKIFISGKLPQLTIQHQNLLHLSFQQELGPKESRSHLNNMLHSFQE